MYRHESKQLALSIEKAAQMLQWRPVLDFKMAVWMTVAWYHQRHLLKDCNMVEVTRRQIGAYTDAAKLKGLAWALDTL
jgi:hypothetical protein